jgi:hypothetical protein
MTEGNEAEMSRMWLDHYHRIFDMIRCQQCGHPSLAVTRDGLKNPNNLGYSNSLKSSREIRGTSVFDMHLIDEQLQLRTPAPKYMNFVWRRF